MKTYEKFIETGNAHGKKWTERYVATPDPKREGMYKVSFSRSDDGYKYSWSHLYGKKNQAEILEMIKTMTEV